MSGAEPALVLGLVSSVLSILEAAYDVYTAVHDAKGLTATFKVTADQIPLVLHTLELAERSIRGNNVRDDALRSVKPAMDRCKENAGTVKDIFDKVLPSRDASRTERYKKAAEMKLKGGEVKKSMRLVMEALDSLAQHQIFQDADTLEDIRTAIEALTKTGDGEENARSVHYGSGNITNYEGSGNQENNNNSSTGSFYKAENMSFAVTIADRSSSRRSGLFTVPRSVNRLFIGREDILKRLSGLIVDGDKAATKRNEQKRIAITGLGGLGKSELCLRLINFVRPSFDNVLWVDVGDNRAAEQAFISISKRLGLQAENLAEAVQDLGSIEQTWLLILDNADDLKTDYQPFFPSCSRGTVIMTSRNPDCGREYGRSHWERLDVLNHSESTDLLMRAADIPRSSPRRPRAEKLAEALGYHTLAMILAGSYIAGEYCELEEYLEVYEKNWRRVVSYSSSQDRSRYGSVLKTFEASMTILEAGDTKAAYDALDMLCILSTLATSDVPVALFEKAWRGAVHVTQSEVTGDFDNLEKLSGWHVSKLPSFLNMPTDEWDQYDMVEAYRTLNALSLATITGERRARKLSMHPLIHDWIWRRQDQQQMEQSWTVAGSALSLSLHADVTWHEYEGEYRIHLAAFVTTWWIHALFPTSTLPILQIICRCAYASDLVRADRVALRCLDKIAQALEISDRAANVEHIQFTELWARSRRRNGDLRGSVVLMERVVGVREGTLKRDHPDRLASQHELASAYLANGQVDKVITLLEHVVGVREGTLKKDHPDRLASQHELASAYRANGQVDRAMTLLEHVVGVREGTLNKDHPSRLASQHELASTYLSNGQVDKAITLLEHVVGVEEGTLKNNHPGRLASQQELARAYRANRKVNKADPL